MAFEIPNDLLKKVQALLRKESGSLSTYDPHDLSNIHPLPSLDASISELDKLLPGNARCTKCNAKFLRGTHSLICIYCGSKKQVEDNLPDPISFNSSFGCQWLLHSLDLDKSDSVGLRNNGAFEVNKKHRSLKQKTTLHGRLDFNIALSDESEKPKTSVKNKALDQRRSLNLTGAYLGKYISKSPSIVYSVPEGPVTEHFKSSRSKIFVGEEKLASSLTISTGDSVVGTSENNDFKVSRQDENFKGSVDARDGPSPGDIELQHSDVAEYVDDNECQVNNTSAPSDSTIDRHDSSLDN